MVQISINGAHAAVRKQEVLTVGMVGAIAEFLFYDDAWDSLSKVAVFQQGNVTKDAVIVDGKATIPWEVLQLPGIPVSIGVYGAREDGSVVVPTVWAKTNPVQPAADPSGDESYPPTPDIGEQVLMIAENAQKISELVMAEELSRNAAEIERKANEEVRVANEANRVGAEFQRVAAETARENKETGYVAQAKSHADRAETVAAGVYSAVVDAQAAKSAAQQAQQNAENASNYANNAAGYANESAVSANNAAGYANTSARNAAESESAAKAAQVAAEKARDDAQSIAGGNFASEEYVDAKVDTAEQNANTYTNGQINAHNEGSDAHADIRQAVNAAQTTANEAKNAIPTKVSQLTNDSGYLTSVPVAAVNGKTGDVQLGADDVGARPNTWTPTAADVGLTTENWTFTLEDGSTVRKKIYIGDMSIRFTINGESYTGEEWMTWADWNASDFNTTGQKVVSVTDASGNSVSLDSVIVGGTAYEA